MNHNTKMLFWMIAACALPAIIIWSLVKGGISLSSGWIFIIFMSVCVGMHLMMMRGGHGCGGHGQDGNEKNYSEHEHK